MRNFGIRTVLLISIASATVGAAAAVWIHQSNIRRIPETKDFLGQTHYRNTAQTTDDVFLLFSWSRDRSLPPPHYAYLMNRDGSIYHQWDLPKSALFGRITRSGNLLALHSAAPKDRQSHIAGECNQIAEYDWQGKVVWNFERPLLHHDVLEIDDDTVATLLSEPVPSLIRKRHFDQVSGEAYSDRVVFIQKSTGQITWDWSLTSALPDFADRIESRSHFDVTHTNSIDYTAKNPLNGKPAILLSVRELSSLIMVDIETKKVLWTSPKGLFRVQHDGQFLKDGSILVFDNGTRLNHVKTRVAIINPLNNRVIWEWSDPFDFWATPLMGGVQELSNGNILITNSNIGQLFEVNREKKIVWNFLGQLALDPRFRETEWWPGEIYYRVHAYPRPR